MNKYDSMQDEGKGSKSGPQGLGQTDKRFVFTMKIL
jgi:hypothetical protein